LTPSQLKAKRKTFSILVTLIVLIIITFVISMNTGVIKLTSMEVLRTLFGQGDAQQQLILFSFRLPRIVILVLVGMG
ncbi:iron chelate uptake ABC transporter family permease subunit, partial [Bacillus velezensis]|uniref:iron chelate uptake ABC transporter family permease subunit n=1 Tax=Bacillus velezensis TaxID=492670 RepID=UPI0020BEF9B7